MTIFLIGVDAGYQLDVDHIGPVGSDEAGGVKDFLEVTHRAVLQEGAVVGVDLDVVIGGFEVVDVFDGDDLNFAGSFYDYTLLLGGGFGGGIQEGLGGGGGGGGRRFRLVSVEAFAEGFVEALFGEGLQKIIDGVGLEGADGVFVKGGGEDDGGRVFDEFEHFEAVDLRHLDIEEDEVGMVLLNRFQALKSVIAFLNYGDIRVRLEVFANDHAREGLIVDEDGGDWLG